MGKRSNFKRIGKDKYRTFDLRAGRALGPYLCAGQKFWEPCAAALDLVKQVESYGPECVCATDIAPEVETVFRLDALTATREDVDATGATHIITNPPWSRPILHAMIRLFASIRPTWLLFDADWLQTQQSIPFLPMLVRVVAVGRLKFIPDTAMDGKDNCSWYLFDARHTGGTEFVGRVAR